MDLQQNKKQGFLLLLTLIIVQLTVGQISNDFGYQDYKKRFPKESYVFLDLSTTDVFDITKEGLEVKTYAKEQILYLDNNAYNFSKRGVYYDQFTSVANVEATSFYPVKGKYKKEKVKEFKNEQVISEGISFYDDSWNKKFSFQNLKEGAVTNLEYERTHKEFRLLHQRSFSRGVYIKKETNAFKVHKDIQLGFKLFNIEEDSSIQYSEKEEGDYKIYSWEVKDREKQVVYGDERYDLYYLPHIVPFVKSYKVEGKEVPVFRNLDDLYAWYYSLVNQVKPSEKKELKELADSLTEGLTSDIEKVKRVYYWVQSQVKYIAFGDGYGGFVPRDPDLIYERRFGDCKDMSCLTINLLKELEIPAYFTWVGTRKIPYGYSELYTPQVDNHMIATYIDEEGNKLYLDATDPDLEFGRPSAMIQGKEVLISMGKDDYLVENVPILEAEVNKEIDSVYLELEEDKIIGKGQILFTGYLAAEVYNSFNGVKEEVLKTRFKRRLSKGSNKFVADSILFGLVNNSKDSLRLTYNFEVGSYTKSVGNDLYLNLNLTKQLRDWKFNEKQNVPVIIDYRWYLEKNFALKLPQDYQVDYLPENISFEDERIKYSIDYELKEGELNYKLKFKAKTTLLEVEEIKPWNAAMKTLGEAMDESLKLKKI